MKRVITVIIAAVITLIVPLTVLLTGFCLPSQFEETYYGELSYMFDKLCGTKGKKIVLVGNSAVAFGVRSDLLQAELPDYTVVNFGLYGAIGTKTMLDLSKANISEGDIVIVMPELVEQSCSLYFSAKDTWRAVDSDKSMLQYVAIENRGAMASAFTAYTSEKFLFFKNDEKPSTNGVYNRKSFQRENGENVDYVVYDRPYNIMSGGYDPTWTLDEGDITFGEGFFDYLNAYNAYATACGATVFYGFTPFNSLAVNTAAKEKIADEFYNLLRTELEFDIIGHPEKYFLDYKWFYDNNVHMNSAGMYIYTDLLAEDLKLACGITAPNTIKLPSAPEIPTNVVMGDDSDATMFTYVKIIGKTGEYIRLTGLTDEGKRKTSLIIPADYDGVPVREFTSDVFQNNTVISRIVLSENIGTIYDYAFDGATRLSELVFRHDSVLGLNVGENFLSGADNCCIYIKKGVSIANCAGGWERYQSRIRYY